MKKYFTTEFDFGQKVFLKTEPETIRMVTGFLVNKDSVMVGLKKGEDMTFHDMYEVESCKVFKIKGFKG